MHTKYAFLAIILIQTLCASAVDARGSAITGRASLMADTTFPCTLDVVLVAFQDTAAARPMSPMDCRGLVCDYHEHDRPYGDNPGESSIHADSSYTLRDFERLFNGGYDGLPDFVGTNQTVGAGHRLPEVFGSVRAYYDSVSNGAFQLHVRMINPADDQGYPRWVELPRTKAHYAEIDIDDGTSRLDDRSRTRGNWFWDDAYMAAQAAVDIWYPDTNEYDLPNDSYDTARRLRRKVLYLYSGATYTARSSAGLLHPHVDEITADNPTVGNPDKVGYRYVMGEREGWGDNDHDIDEFAGIFTHAHEIGHLLGLVHPGGQWRGPNPYTEALLDTNYNAANLMDWGLMQGTGSGPRQTDRSNSPNLYHRAYRSSPNPINPFYRVDLGWLTPTEITESRDNYVIEPGTVHRITRPTNRGLQVEYLLERRPHDGMERMEDGQVVGGRSFGRYVSYHEYTNTDPGLFIWRRHSNRERPMLIVADERRFMNARDRDYSPRIHEHRDMRYDPFPVAADTVQVEDDNGNLTIRHIQTAVNSADSQTAMSGLRQTTRNGTRAGGRQPDPGDVGLAITDITRTPTDTITVDIYMAPPSPPTNVTAVVSNGQATLRWHLPAPSDSGPQPPPPSYQYRQSIDGGTTWEAAIAVAAGSTDARSQTIALVPNTDYIFAVRAVNPVGSSAWVRPFVLAGPTAIAFAEVVAPEAERRTVATYTATDPEGDRIAWSLAGTDADDFALSPNGQLTFQNDPDFEAPTDRNHPPDQDPPTDPGENNSYHLTIQARAGQQSATLAVTVTVTDADESGVVVLSSLSPQVDVPLTATWSGFRDGIVSTRWQWQRKSRSAAPWTNLAEVSSQPQPGVSLYTPPAGDVGYPLRATVRYTDADGTTRRIESAATAPVRAAPTRVNRPPSAPVGPSAVSVAEHTTAIGTYTSTDPDGDALSWTVSPAALFSIDGGVLSFKNAPDYESGQTVYTATLQTYDGALWSPSKTVTVQVTDVDDIAPVLALVGPLTCYVGEYCSFTFPVATSGTEPITYTVSPPSWAKASGRSFSGTAPKSPGSFSASLRASNAYGTDSESVTINVKKRGYSPVLASVSSITCYVGEYCSFTFPAATSGTEPITYTVSPPSWAKASGRSFSGTAPKSPGSFSASLRASNAYGTDSESVTINVKKRGYSPVLASVSSVTCYVGEYCSFTFPAATSGTEPITYTVSPPSWAKASGRSFSGTAPKSPGTFSASLNASNAYGTDSESVTINVKKRPVAGVAPVLPSVSSITCYVGEYCSFTFPVASKGTEPITYTVSPPSWAKASGRSFSGTAPKSPGTFSASLNASNAYGTDSESVTINVKKRLAIAPGAPAVPSAASGFIIGAMA